MLNSKEAYEQAKADTLYVKNLRIRDSLRILSELPVPMDSLLGNNPILIKSDSILKDSTAADINSLLKN